ncbi:MAG: antibiotic biosynthesis monooxygenase [Gemmatimonadota bacterium]
MIIRTWKATNLCARDDEYRDAVERTVLPHLAEMPGYLGTLWLRQERGERFDYVVLTCWDSMETVHSFAGEDPSRAWIPEEVLAALEEAGTTSEHFELAYGHELERLAGATAEWTI